MKHEVIAYQLIRVESGDCCTTATTDLIAVKQDPQDLAEILRQDYNSTLVGDHQEPNIRKGKKIEIKDGNLWTKTSESGDLVYTWQVMRLKLNIEVTFPLHHRHEDGVELEVK